MFKVATASMLLAGALLVGGVAESEARAMRTVTCSNGKTVTVSDSQSSASACARLGSASAGGTGTSAKAKNPCGPGQPTKGCRDYINGNPKPPIKLKK
jgi:hypothetical protein